MNRKKNHLNESSSQIKAKTPWKTITIGRFKSIIEIQKSIKNSGYIINKWANEMLTHQNFTLGSKKISIFKNTLYELGFKDGAYYRDICSVLLERGFDLCPGEIAPALCSHYKGELLYVAMKPIELSDGNPDIFVIGYNKQNELELGNNAGNPGALWSSNANFIFCSTDKID